MTIPWVKINMEWFGDQVMAATEEAMLPILMQLGMLVQVEAQKSLRIDGGIPSKTKRKVPYEYWNTARGGYVIASTPPKPPHFQTGHLHNSITEALTSKRTVLVGPTRMAWYGKVHEKGKRPFMLPALTRVAPKFPKYCRLALARTKAGMKLNNKTGKPINGGNIH